MALLCETMTYFTCRNHKWKCFGPQFSKKLFKVTSFIDLTWPINFAQIFFFSFAPNRIVDPKSHLLFSSKMKLSRSFLNGKPHWQGTPWILALKWCKQNMSLEKIYFALWKLRKLEKKEFLKSCIVLLRAELNCTNYASRMGRLAGAC